jgi:hypothetical protein
VYISIIYKQGIRENGEIDFVALKFQKALNLKYLNFKFTNLKYLTGEPK